MLILTASKMLVIAGVMTTLAGAAVGTAILFASYLISSAKNPDEAENLFNTTLMAFALVETFVFFAFLIAGVSYLFIR
ncbi:UNVERIFIED_CONTAM: hypothetical protein GTU68_024856 [Idotea baltica]|nr:hypothetical protein [Idotea baltica]